MIKLVKERREARLYRNGFVWCMSAFYMDKKSIEEIQTHLGIGDKFDEGALYALTLIQRASNDSIAAVINLAVAIKDADHGAYQVRALSNPHDAPQTIVLQVTTKIRNKLAGVSKLIEIDGLRYVDNTYFNLEIVRSIQRMFKDLREGK